MIIGVATLKALPTSQLVRAFQAHCRSFISESYISGMVAPWFDRRQGKIEPSSDS